MNSLILDVPNTYKPTFLKGLDKCIKSKKKNVYKYIFINAL